MKLKRKLDAQCLKPKKEALYATTSKTAPDLGDTLFVPTRNFVSEYKIVSFHVCGEGIWYRTNIVKGILTRLISDNVENIGKTVFLTREEAERALKLKERESNA